ncbi:MAG: peptide/nickel transport system permease protein [Gaiellales bacterium]|nr:peptide/nickel transport system permease protein [Gaiellales bacterium]
MAAVVTEPLGGFVEQRRRGFWQRWYRTPAFVAGLLILGTLIGLAVLAPVVTSHPPNEQNLRNVLQGPSSEHWLGTDQLGRDLWSRLVYAGRTDLKIGFLAVLLPFCIGTVVGSLAGYYGRWLDTIALFFVNVVVAFPFLVLLTAILFALGPSERSIYIAITLVGWVSYCRIIRAEILVAKRQEYVLAAQAAGLGDLRIIARHILPNVITQSIVFAMSDIVLVLAAIVTLGYIGIGVQPPTPDWGTMVADGQNFLTTKWQLSTMPGLAVVVTGLGLSLLGDGIADLLRPE